MGGKPWESKEKGHSAKVDWTYIEMEAARFWGYTLGDWQREETVFAARAIAHYLEHCKRDGYNHEAAKEAANQKADKKKPVDFFSNKLTRRRKQE